MLILVSSGGCALWWVEVEGSCGEVFSWLGRLGKGGFVWKLQRGFQLGVQVGVGWVGDGGFFVIRWVLFYVCYWKTVRQVDLMLFVFYQWYENGFREQEICSSRGFFVLFRGVVVVVTFLVLYIFFVLIGQRF